MTTARSAVTCSWCGRYFPARPELGECSNCGGPLPAPTGTDRGPAPPSAPRVLPPAYRRQVRFSRNALSIVGTVFLCVGTPFLLVAGVLLVVGVLLANAATLVMLILVLVFGLLGLVFVGVGAPLLMAGLRRARRRLGALELGIPAEGELVSVEQNLSVRINGRNPWTIEYAFDASGVRVRGTVQSLFGAEGDRQAGDRVWVVYLPADPGTSTLWPPVR